LAAAFLMRVRRGEAYFFEVDDDPDLPPLHDPAAVDRQPEDRTCGSFRSKILHPVEAGSILSPINEKDSATAKLEK
jgi:hypothetical protein